MVVVDDSGSMQYPADPDVYPSLSRWEELKKTLKIVVEAHELLGISMDFYFLNRGAYFHIQNWGQIQNMFMAGPSGGTNIVRSLDQIYRDRVNVDMSRSLIVHIFTDGHPTDAYGNENIQQVSFLHSKEYSLFNNLPTPVILFSLHTGFKIEAPCTRHFFLSFYAQMTRLEAIIKKK